MKKVISLLMLIALLSVTGCQAGTETTAVATTEAAVTTEATTVETTEAAPEVPESIRVIAPEGAPTFSMLQLIYETPDIYNGVEVDYESIAATDLLSAEIIAGNVDFAVVPTNLALNLYNKGVPYKLAGIATQGNLYMVTSEDISTWDDLRGKEVYMIGQGLVPDLIFRYLLQANGLDPENDLTITYLAGTTEVGPTFIAGKSTITIMPEPVLSTLQAKGIDFKVLFDFQEEFSKASGFEGGYPQAGILVKNSTAETYPELVDAFLQSFESATVWLNENPDQAGVYEESLELGIPAAIFEKAIPGLNIHYESAQSAAEKLMAFYEILPIETIGGALPDAGFYYEGQ
ncbi:MAG: NitT/TauT family transport system substrate-binding protein [Clostridiales bacterium]|jgi:NitT/TauT family transport system substrate-binding protein|nr:NitT/TauT family transport system substrate-binding protein [Clostridiales bacterium]